MQEQANLEELIGKLPGMGPFQTPDAIRELAAHIQTILLAWEQDGSWEREFALVSGVLQGFASILECSDVKCAETRNVAELKQRHARLNAALFKYLMAAHGLDADGGDESVIEATGKDVSDAAAEVRSWLECPEGSVDELDETAWNLLKEMHNSEAHSCAEAICSEMIAQQAGYAEASTVRKHMLRLKDGGWCQSRHGATGGYWLTPKGKEAVRQSF